MCLCSQRNGTMTLVDKEETFVFPFIVHFKVVRGH